MVFKFVFDPTAAEEYQHAFEWYEKRSAIAADNFIISVQDAIQQICKDPYRYRNTYKDLRELKVSKYPYQIIYLINKAKKLIIIASVFHTKRNPKKKYKRKNF